MKFLRKLFRRRMTMEELEVLMCHFVVLSEGLADTPECDELGRMAEKELYKIKVQYPELNRPTLEEAKIKGGYPTTLDI